MFRKKIDRLSFILLLFVILLYAGRVTYAQSPQQTFNRANELYQHHAYDSAAKLYENLIAQGYQNSELYYNAGNANYKARHAGYAVYYFEKALQHSPGNDVIEHNLQLAHQLATNKIDQVPTLFFIRWWHQLLHLHRANGWLTGSIILFWVVLFFLGWRWLKPPASRWTRWIVILSALLFCLYLSGAIGTWYRSVHELYAVVIIPDQVVKAAPDTNSSDVLDIHEGLKVKVIDSVGDWKKILLENDKEGWVPSSSMLRL